MRSPLVRHDGEVLERAGDAELARMHDALVIWSRLHSGERGQVEGHGTPVIAEELDRRALMRAQEGGRA